MVEGPAPGRDSVIAIDEQDRENVVADGLKTSHADKGNRRGNKSVFLGAFPNEINSLGRRFGSHQPPHHPKAPRAARCGTVIDHAGAEPYVSASMAAW